MDLFLKTDFIFSEKIFLRAVGIIEPPVEMHFHKRFAVTRLWKNLFLQPTNTGGSQNRCKKRLRTACIVCLSTSVYSILLFFGLERPGIDQSEVDDDVLVFLG
jgi:hypothetical protein